MLYKAGKYEQARPEIMIAREADIVLANAFIADMYFYGEGVPTDQQKALEYNLKAANDGVAYSALNTGFAYRDALGTKEDFVEALRWFRRAHELGEKDAALPIGWAYENGQAVKVDYPEAMRWYQLAAKNGNSDGVNNVGSLYQRGLSVARDDVKALVWYRRAQSMGHAKANINVANMTDIGVVTDKNPALAVDYVLKAFDIGDRFQDPDNAVTFLSFYKWSPEFWTIMQQKLKDMGHYTGPIDGKLSAETKAAFDKIVDR
jgi:uncharacterized protein